MAYLRIILNNTILININGFFIWIGNPKVPNPCLVRFRLAAGVFCFLITGTPFLKRRVWGPQAMFATFQACRRSLKKKNDRSF